MSAAKSSIASTADGTTRVQLDFSPNAIERINKAMALCELQTRKELFNNALSLFDWAIEELTKGRIIASLDEDGKHYTKLVMPAFQTASQNAKRQKEAAKDREYVAA